MRQTCNCLVVDFFPYGSSLCPNKFYIEIYNESTNNGAPQGNNHMYINNWGSKTNMSAFETVSFMDPNVMQVFINVSSTSESMRIHAFKFTNH